MVRVPSMVNDSSYRSVSGGILFAESSQRKRPLSPAARRWDVSPSRGNDASGRNGRVFPEMVKPITVCHPSKG
jgi:hypothetical protein